MENGDALGAHRWAKGWIGSGGGGRLLDPWLTYVAVDLMRRQPRGSVNAADLALRFWIEREADRAILLWIRATIVRNWLKDPKTAVRDYALARGSAPAWVLHGLDTDWAACEIEAQASRKRKASVKPAPIYEASTEVEPSNGQEPADSDEPEMFRFVALLLAPD